VVHLGRARELTQGHCPLVQVPKGHCYIVGDNLPWSRDSRDFGPIPLALIRGKVVAKGSITGFNPMSWFTRVENGLRKPAEMAQPEHQPAVDIGRING
jgi:hypothetical protein